MKMMFKKGEGNTGVLVASIIVLVLLVGGLYYANSSGLLDLGAAKDNAVNTVNNIDIDLGADDVGSDQLVQSRDSVCDNYETNYPNYFFVRSLQCQAAGGDYICEQDRAGCYDITSWDYLTMCSSTEVQALKGACSIMGGDWTCTSVEISCER